MQNAWHMTPREIVNLISVFHDGYIDSIKAKSQSIHISISCSYLAQIRQPGTEYFHLELHQAQSFRFTSWDGEEVEHLNEIAKLELEILNAEVVANSVEVSCAADEKVVSCGGGTLIIQALSAEVRAQNGELLTRETLFQLANDYWNGERLHGMHITPKKD